MQTSLNLSLLLYLRNLITFVIEMNTPYQSTGGREWTAPVQKCFRLFLQHQTTGQCGRWSPNDGEYDDIIDRIVFAF